jgi:hypothetical protein
LIGGRAASTLACAACAAETAPASAAPAAVGKKLSVEAQTVFVDLPSVTRYCHSVRFGVTPKLVLCPAVSMTHS